MATFITNEITSAVIVDKLESQLLNLDAITLDASENSIESGNSVTVAVVGGGSTLGGEFNGDYLANANADITKVQVSLKHYFKSYFVREDHASKGGANRVANLVEANVSAFAKYLNDEFLSKIAKASFTPVTATDTDYGIDDVKALVAKLDAQGQPLEDRSLLLKTACHGNILPTDINSYNVSALESGRVPNLLGMATQPTNGTFDDDINSIALHKTGVVGAFRSVFVQSPESLVDYQSIVLPNGIPVGVRTFYDVQSGKLAQSIEVMAGFAIANSDAIAVSSAS
jgi:hypothetical protein